MRIVVCKYSRLDEHDRGIVKPYCSWSLKEAKYIKKVLLNLNVFFFQESSHKKVPIMLCGNKCDLRDSYLREGRKVVSRESGQRLAKVSVNKRRSLLDL